MAGLSIAQRMEQLPVLPIHRKITAIVGIGVFFDLFDIFLAGTISTVLAKQFHITNSNELNLLLGSAFFGMFLGAIIVNRLADKLGRRKAYLINLGVYSLFTFVGAFSPNAAFLIVCRFLAGFGLGAQPPLSDSYLSEMLPSEVRGKYISWAYTLSFLAIPCAGFIARGLVPAHPFGVAGWRWMFVLGSLGSVITWFFQRALPESPRWLESVGRVAEANEWIAQYEGGAVAASKEAPSAGTSPSKASVSDLFGPTYGKRTFMLWLFQILQSVAYYGFGTLVPLVLKAKGYSVVSSLEYTALVFIGYPIGSLLSIPLVERIQRKWLIVGTALGMAIFGLLFGYASSPTTIMLYGFLYTAVSNMFSNAYHVFQAEIFPTEVRATAAGWGYSLSRLSSGLMPFVLLPVLHGQGAGAMFTYVAAGLVIIMLDIGLLGPKSTRKPLEEITGISA